MKQLTSIGLALVGVFLTGAIFAGQEPAEAKYYKKRVNHRQVHQQKRLIQGGKSKSLTGKEMKRLQKQQAKLAMTEKKMRATDGLSKKEAAKLEVMQDKLSRNIYQQKHDSQTRN